MSTAIRKSHPILNHRVELFGLATLMIIYHHLGNRGLPGVAALPSVIQNILSFVFLKASLGVDIFVFLSAVGLCYSMEKNSLGQFYINRFKRVGLSWLIIMVPTFIVEEFVLARESFGGFLLDVTTLRYWVDNPNTHTPWFVPFIMAMYLVFPLLYHLDKVTKHISTVTLLVVAVAWVFVGQAIQNPVYLQFAICFSRLPIFLLGMLLARRFKETDTMDKRLAIPVLIVSSAAYVAWYFMDLAMGANLLMGSVVSLGIMVAYAWLRQVWKAKWASKLFLLIGAVSLEMYLVHTVILRVVDACDEPDIVFASLYVLLPVVSLLLSKLVSLIVNALTKKRKKA